MTRLGPGGLLAARYLAHTWRLAPVPECLAASCSASLCALRPPSWRARGPASPASPLGGGAARWRGFAAAAEAPPQPEPRKSSSPPRGDEVESSRQYQALTDRIPQRPVSVVEGTSYTLVILAALGFAAAVVYAAASELLLQPKEYVCYNAALEHIREDPRVTVRLGTPISAYGTESRNRAARQRIPHRVYTDDRGHEHVQVQFHLRGPSGRATVSADMYKADETGAEWQYAFLYMDTEAPVRQRVFFHRPEAPQ